MFYRRVGEIFSFKDKEIEVVEVKRAQCFNNDNRRCIFYGESCSADSNISNLRGFCSFFSRPDGKNVIFLEVIK
jgi:hypothetical protein